MLMVAKNCERNFGVLRSELDGNLENSIDTTTFTVLTLQFNYFYGKKWTVDLINLI